LIQTAFYELFMLCFTFSIKWQMLITEMEVVVNQIINNVGSIVCFTLLYVTLGYHSCHGPNSNPVFSKYIGVTQCR
jgi:hypothetical protein